MKKIKAISLFSGAGGDTLGLIKANIDVVAFSEFDKKAIITHKTNFPNSKLIGEKFNGGDITKIPNSEFEKFKGKIDLIFAGFPCQGFSHAGKKIIEDDRNQLFREFVRVVDIIKPKYIIGENVKGLLERKNRDFNFADLINKEFEKIGYQMNEPLLLSLEKFGVPQLRRRVFFIGKLDHSGEKIEINLNDEIEEKNIRNIITSSLEGAIGINLNDFSYLKEALKNSEITFLETSEDITGKPHPFLLRKITSKEISFDVRKSPHFVQILNLDKPAKTINCAYVFQPRQFILLKKNNEFYIRKLLTKELQQIQGFPKNFVFKESENDAIKQIGNAVPPIIVTKIAKKLITN